MSKQTVVMIGSFLVTVGIWALLLRDLWMSLTLVFLVLVHEFGHWLAARRKGIAVQLPVFTPTGAYVKILSEPQNIAVEAFLAIAGPVFGGLGSLAVLQFAAVWQSPYLVHIAVINCVINLLNLLPFSPLDGGRVALAIHRKMWIVGFAVVAAVIYFGNIGLLALVIAAMMLVQAFGDIETRDVMIEQKPDYYSLPIMGRLVYLCLYLGVAAVLAWMIMQPASFAWFSVAS